MAEWWKNNDNDVLFGSNGAYPGVTPAQVDAAAYKAYRPSTGLAANGVQGTDWQGGLNTGANILNAGTGLANAYLGYKNYGLAKDQFDFSKAATNRDILNQGTLTNNSIQNASDVGLALGGGAMTADQIAREKAAVQNRYVNTSAIG